jgi:hypothetical protein
MLNASSARLELVLEIVPPLVERQRAGTYTARPMLLLAEVCPTREGA